MRKNSNNDIDIARFAAEATKNQEMEQAVREQIQETALVNALEDLRVRKGLRQKDIAERMGVSISTVSRIEDSRDADLSYGDLAGYVNALGMNMTLFLEEPSLPAAEQIKHCVFLISDLLKKLTSLAKECQNDPAIFDGIARFQGEVLYNFMLEHAKSAIDSPIRISCPQQSAKCNKQKQSKTLASAHTNL